MPVWKPGLHFTGFFAALRMTSILKTQRRRLFDSSAPLRLRVSKSCFPPHTPSANFCIASSCFAMLSTRRNCVRQRSKLCCGRWTRKYTSPCRKSVRKRRPMVNVMSFPLNAISARSFFVRNFPAVPR